MAVAIMAFWSDHIWMRGLELRRIHVLSTVHFTQPVQGRFNAPLTHLAVLHKQHGHREGGTSCSAYNPSSEVESSETSWCLSRWVNRQTKSQVGIYFNGGEIGLNSKEFNRNMTEWTFFTFLSKVFYRFHAV